MPKKLKVEWWEPWTVTRMNAVAELRNTGLLSAWFWLRLFGVGGAVAALFAGTCLWAVPTMQVPWWDVLLAVLLGMGLLVFAGLMLFVPRGYTLKQKTIHTSHGAHYVKTLDGAYLDLSDEQAYVVLLQRSRWKNKPATTVRWGLSRKVDYAKLHEILEAWGFCSRVDIWQ